MLSTEQPIPDLRTGRGPHVHYPTNPLPEQSFMKIREAARSCSCLPVGALRRSSSEKFGRNVSWVTGVSAFALSATNAARRLPSGATSYLGITPVFRRRVSVHIRRERVDPAVWVALAAKASQAGSPARRLRGIGKVRYGKLLRGLVCSRTLSRASSRRRRNGHDPRPMSASAPSSC